MGKEGWWRRREVVRVVACGGEGITASGDRLALVVVVASGVEVRVRGGGGWEDYCQRRP
jgi:hypothetical protein